jgi:hypothetical protein
VTGRRGGRALAGGALFCALLGGSNYAHAELHDAVERIAQAWKAVGATVVIGPSRFMNEDETAALVLPDLPDGQCTTVLLLASRGLGFHVSLGDIHDEDPSRRVASEGGALSIERCGESLPHRFLVTSDSGRGAIESLAARSPVPLPRLHAILPERAEGQLGPLAEPGSLAPLPPPDRRAEVAEGRAERDGAAIGRRRSWVAGLDGAGTGEETVDAGCHTLTLFAVDPRAEHPLRRGRLDLDAELRDASDDRLLARDHTDAPDAELAVCVGETTAVSIFFAGSPPGSQVLMSHSAWALPDHLPSLWGREAPARMARVLLTRHVSGLPFEPILLAQGASGSTAIPVEIEPGGCYLAIVALVQGAGHAVGLRVHVGGRDMADDRGVDDNGAAVAFCAEGHSVARAEVEAHGMPLLGWGLAVYRLQSGVWELPW